MMTACISISILARKSSERTLEMIKTSFNKCGCVWVWDCGPATDQRPVQGMLCLQGTPGFGSGSPVTTKGIRRVQKVDGWRVSWSNSHIHLFKSLPLIQLVPQHHAKILNLDLFIHNTLCFCPFQDSKCLQANKTEKPNSQCNEILTLLSTLQTYLKNTQNM